MSNAIKIRDTVYVKKYPLPEDALLLGMADDDLPMLLGVNSETVKSILVCGENDNDDRIKLLRYVANFISLTNSPIINDFSVLSNGEWTHTKKMNAVFSFDDTASNDLLLYLTGWIHNRKHEKKTFLFIDDLSQLKKLTQESMEYLLRLLRYGATSGVWVIGSMNINDDVPKYIVDAFKTFVYSIGNEQYLMKDWNDDMIRFRITDLE